MKLRLKSGLSDNLKTTRVNLKKLHRKVKHNEKMCHTQELVPTFKVKATIMGWQSDHFSVIT